MRAITHALLDSLDLPPGAVVDLGCGGGALLAEMKQRYVERPCIGLDLFAQAAMQASQAIPGRVLQADLSRLPLSEERVALLLALDSFDQAGVNLQTALGEARRVLCPEGLLVVRVSAGAWLYGPHDVAFNTGRRYARRPIVAAIAESGFRIQRYTHANLVLAPPVVLIRLMQKAEFLPLSTALYTNATANEIMAMSLVAESRCLQQCDLPYGLSLYVLARKEAT